MFSIEKSVPYEKLGHRGRMPKTNIKFPWEEMEVGDSFFIPVGNMDVVRLMNKITASGRGYFGAGHVSSRSTVEDNVFGIRTWRIA